MLASPALYASGTPTTVTLSIWLPDSDLNTSSVTAYETDQSGVHSNSKGVLNDSGLNGDAKSEDKVYTVQFAVNDATPAKHYYAVSYKSISSGTTYSTEVDSTASVPIVRVSDMASYSQNIQDSISRIVGATSSYQAIHPTSATVINQTALENYTSTIVSVMGNIQQLSLFDSANPMVAHTRMGGANFAIRPMGGGFSFWSLVPFGLGDLLKKSNELAPEKAAFLGPSFNPNDPAVGGVIAWLAKSPNYEAACDPDIASDAGCRAVIWPYYAESPDAGLLEAAASSAKSFAISQYTGMAEDSAGDLLLNQTDLTPLAKWLIEQGTGIATDYFVDNFTASSGRQMLVFGSVSEGQTTALPNGSHNIILANSSTRVETPGVVAPAIGALAPALLPVGSAPQTLTINGTGFLSTSTVDYNGVGHDPVFVDATQLTISLTSADLASAGTYPVAVTNPAPGGGASSAANFSVGSARAAGQWTWMGGSSTWGAYGTYGTLGVPFSANIPGARYAGVSWTDGNGNFWLFGGAGYSGNLNDLWKFTPLTNEWTWTSGSENGDYHGLGGVYGILGIPDAANVPGGRPSAVSWMDSSNKLWLFGGSAYGDTSSNYFYFNDLWKYDPAIKEWAWESGNNCACHSGKSGTQGVPDVANSPMSRDGSVSWTDSHGNLWLFGGFGSNGIGYYVPFNDLWKYNPASHEWTWMTGSDQRLGDGPAVYGTKGVPAIDNVPGARRDAVSWTDKSGNLWLLGGYGYDSTWHKNLLNDLWKFSPSANEWTWISGTNIGNQPGVYGTQGVTASSNIPGARTSPVSWTDKKGNLWLFGGNGYDAAGMGGPLNDLWVFNPLSMAWTWEGGANIENQAGVYGVHGVPDAANFPGARGGAVGWTDKDGNLWLFGGSGIDSTTNSSGIFNDLWRYQP